MVLFINGNYPHHSLHGELVSKLAEMGNDIIVYVPIKDPNIGGRYRCEHPRVQIYYSVILNTFDRVFFIHKIHKLVKNIEKEIDLKKVDCILAGTMYSDGVVAYRLHKKYDIPFAFTLRETDVSFHMKWRPYLNSFMKKLVKDSSKIILISPSYKKHLYRFKCDAGKIVIIPNAISDYWFQNSIKKERLNNPIELIYVGEISKRKNVRIIISAVSEILEKGIDINFHIVGAGKEEAKCRCFTESLGICDNVFFHGWQCEKDNIKKYYSKSDIFIMTSLKETFGTVYIEAMSQGLPIVYTKDQGIDGYFRQGVVGFSCNPRNTKEIVDAINSVTKDYKNISDRCIQESRYFQWATIAQQYEGVLVEMMCGDK